MKTKDNENKSRFEERRQKLMEITADARQLRENLANEAKTEAEALAILATPLNDIIVENYYRIADQKPLKTFKQWKEEGKSIIKGSKCYTLWGRPLQAQAAEEGKEVEDEVKKFFPLVYVFTAAQVK